MPPPQKKNYVRNGEPDVWLAFARYRFLCAGARLEPKMLPALLEILPQYRQARSAVGGRWPMGRVWTGLKRLMPQQGALPKLLQSLVDYAFRFNLLAFADINRPAEWAIEIAFATLDCWSAFESSPPRLSWASDPPSIWDSPIASQLPPFSPHPLIPIPTFDPRLDTEEEQELVLEMVLSELPRPRPRAVIQQIREHRKEVLNIYRAAPGWFFSPTLRDEDERARKRRKSNGRGRKRGAIDDFECLAKYQILGVAKSALARDEKLRTDSCTFQTIFDRLNRLAEWLELGLREPTKGGRPRKRGHDS